MKPDGSFNSNLNDHVDAHLLHLVNQGVCSELLLIFYQKLGVNVMSRASVHRCPDGVQDPGVQNPPAELYLNLVVPSNMERELLGILDYLKDNRGVRDIQMGMAPLDEVYLKVVQQGQS